jgi:hypothetical protein
VIRSYPEGIGAKYVGRPDLAVEIARIRAKAAADGGPGEAAAGEADAHSPRGAHSGRDEDAGRTGNGQDEADSGQEQAGDSDPADDEPHQGHRHWCNFPRFPSIQFDDALGLMRTRPTYLVDGLIHSAHRTNGFLRRVEVVQEFPGGRSGDVRGARLAVRGRKVHSGPVLYITCEGREGSLRRLAAFKRLNSPTTPRRYRST